jgi:hypothetical protein
VLRFADAVNEGLVNSNRHSGMRPLGRRPGIQSRALFWIPGSREDARPGMMVWTAPDGIDVPDW